MSTTWVFVGLLCGRELAIATMNKEYKLKYVFPLIGKDFIKMIFWFKCIVSESYWRFTIFIIPNGAYYGLLAKILFPLLPNCPPVLKR